ncbi:MAG: hypothetical protein SGARI_003376 [Bacillariaceae sp.]
MNNSSTPYTNADDTALGASDGILRGPPIGNVARHTAANADVEAAVPNKPGGGGDFFRLHRDYLQGLDDSVVINLPWSPEQRFAVNTLLEKRGWALLGWSRGITIVAYSVLATMVVFILFAPRIRRDYEGTTREYFRFIGICMFVYNIVAICITLGLYCYYARTDQQLQKLVRRLMDEKDLGMLDESPVMSRDDNNQQAVFELPEFINVIWQRASLASTCNTDCNNNNNDNGSLIGPASEQMSTITVSERFDSTRG